MITSYFQASHWIPLSCLWLGVAISRAMAIWVETLDGPWGSYFLTQPQMAQLVSTPSVWDGVSFMQKFSSLWANWYLMCNSHMSGCLCLCLCITVQKHIAMSMRSRGSRQKTGKLGKWQMHIFWSLKYEVIILFLGNQSLTHALTVPTSCAVVSPETREFQGTS